MNGGNGFRRQFAALTAARWRMWVNSVRARPSIALVTGIGLLAFVLPFALSVGIGTYTSYRSLAGPARDNLLHLTLGGTFLLWVLFPIYSTTLQRTVDVRPMRLLPLGSQRVAFMVSLSTILDATTLALVPVYLPILTAYAGWWWWWALMVLVALTFCALTLSCAVAMLLYRAGAGGRRAMWWLSVLGAAPAVLLYLSFVRTTVVQGHHFGLSQVLAVPWSQWLRWVPPGWAAESIRAAVGGKVGSAAAHFGLLAGGCVCALLLHGWLIGLGAQAGGAARAKRAPRWGRRSGFLYRRLGPTVVSMAGKELRCLFRDAQVRTAMVTTPLAVLPILLMARFAAGEGVRLAAAGMAVPLATIIGGSVFFNTFGMERGSLAATFMQPADRRLVLAGKNLADTALVLAVVGPVVLLAALVGGSWRFAVGGLVGLLVAVPAILAIANYWAIEFPFRTPKRGENPYQMGFLSMWIIGLIHVLGMAVAALLATPALLLVLLGFLLPHGVYLVLTLPLAAAYSGVIYWALLGGAARRLVQSEPDILGTVTAKTRRWAG